MIPNLEQIREVAAKDGYIKEIGVFIDNLSQQDPTKGFYVAKTLFFAPETHPQVRYSIAERMGQYSNTQLFNQLLSYFILRSFPDRRALICALRSFGNREALPALMEYYVEANLRECLEIIETVASIQAPDTIEFLSRIYNEQIEYQSKHDPADLTTIRERASSALSKNLMRFDLF